MPKRRTGWADPIRDLLFAHDQLYRDGDKKQRRALLKQLVEHLSDNRTAESKYCPGEFHSKWKFANQKRVSCHIYTSHVFAE